MRSRSALGLAVAALMALAASGHWLVARVASIDPSDPKVTLADVERWVTTLAPVPEITAANLAAQLERSDTVLFDVRPRAEFDQSHLPGAIQLDPDTDAGSFIAEHGQRLKARTVVFYCSVGLRSGLMLSRLANAMPASQPAAAFNLRGGIFKWFVEGRPVQSASGPAQSVHPFDTSWGLLLARSQKAAK